MHKDIHGVKINQWDIVAVARNDTMHICLVTDIVDGTLMVKRFGHDNCLSYNPSIVKIPTACVVSLMTSPVHVDMWNIRRELMNDSV